MAAIQVGGASPNIRLDVGTSIPAGYIVGRLSGGTGPAQLIPITQLGQALASGGSVSGGGGGGGGGSVTVTAGSGITVTGGPAYTVSLTSPVAVSIGGTGQTSYTDGQLLIGNTTGNTLTKATLTAGTGISVTNGHGSITIANTGVTSVQATNNLTPTSATTGAVTIGLAAFDPPGNDTDVVGWGAVEGLRIKYTCSCATTGNFSATYNNGTGGVGATLTASATGTVVIDGHTIVATGESVLFKNQTTATQNGIYVCTTLGAVGVAAVFTRAIWNDSNPAGGSGFVQTVAGGDTIPVLFGTQNGQSLWMQLNGGSGTGGSIIVGTDNLAYAQVASSTFGNGLWSPGLLGGSTIPTLTNLGTVTNRNFSAGTSVANSTPGIDLVDTDSPASVHAIRGIAWAVPSTPYKKKFLILVDISPTLACHWGIGWSDGTKTDALYFGADGPTVFHTQWTNDSTLASATSLYNNLVYCLTPIWVMLRDDGTTVDWTISATGRFLGTGGSANFCSLRFLKSSGSLGSSGYTNFIVFVDTFTGPVGLSLQAYMNGP